jgi:hypothetical protein
MTKLLYLVDSFWLCKMKSLMNGRKFGISQNLQHVLGIYSLKPKKVTDFFAKMSIGFINY